MDANEIAVLGNAKQKLEYMRRCAYTERVPADSEDLIQVIAALDRLISGKPDDTSAPCGP